MNAETFAEWMRRKGHQVIQTDSTYWYQAGPRVLQAFPYHWRITPTEAELRNLLLRHNMAALRYSTSVGSPRGMISYHIILEPPYDLDRLKCQARNGVKRGTAYFKIEQIEFERLATEGWQLQRDTLERQQRTQCMTQARWERLCRSAAGLPGFEAWAATSEGELAGAVIICRVDDTFLVPYAMSRTCFLDHHVNNTIFYCISREMLARQGIKRVFYTVQPLDAPATVDDFKLRMGFSAVAVRQRVEFHPLLKPFVTTTTHSLVRRRMQQDAASPVLPKAEGVIKFYLQGMRPLAEQAWPECLETQKEALLALHAPAAQGGVPLEGCQLPSLPGIATGVVAPAPQPLLLRVKRALAAPWNQHVKVWLKRAYRSRSGHRPVSQSSPSPAPAPPSVTLQVGERVRVRSRQEIAATLDPFKELKGCAFLEGMYQYCGTEQRVYKTMERFLDERDYKVKKVRGVILLENVICQGTSAFGPCDRSCFLFWREEWLEKIPADAALAG